MLQLSVSFGFRWSGHGPICKHNGLATCPTKPDEARHIDE